VIVHLTRGNRVLRSSYSLAEIYLSSDGNLINKEEKITKRGEIGRSTKRVGTPRIYLIYDTVGIVELLEKATKRF